MGKKRSKKRTHVPVAIDESIPRSFVIKSGHVSPAVAQLVRDIRKMMEPNTASKLKERRGNKIRDFLMVAGQLHVSHLLVFSKSKNGGVNMRIGKMPRGPTITFHVEEYSLAKDVLKLQRRPKSPGLEYLHAPLVVLNNFGDNSKHMQLLATMLQNMFPAIKMKVSEAKRIILFHLNPETKLIEMRHYRITVKTLGISKSIKSIIKTNVPDLKGYEDISDFVTKGAFASESDVEDAPEATISIGDTTDKRAIKLIELGPRLHLKLIKIQDGLCDGEVVHHEFISKSEKEVKNLSMRKDKERREKAQRKEQQEKNVQAKKKAKLEPLEGNKEEALDDYDEDDFSDLLEQDIDDEEEEVFDEGE